MENTNEREHQNERNPRTDRRRTEHGQRRYYFRGRAAPDPPRGRPQSAAASARAWRIVASGPNFDVTGLLIRLVGPIRRPGGFFIGRRGSFSVPQVEVPGVMNVFR